MFYCIGENRTSSTSIGKGKTVNEAINSWASESDQAQIISEWAEWVPTVIEGNEIKIGLSYQFVQA